METHHIHPELLERPVRVLVVGCGGTGSAIVAGLPYLHHYVEFEVKENLRVRK
jgi:myo-inositol-1-phosphate synthase